MVFSKKSVAVIGNLSIYLHYKLYKETALLSLHACGQKKRENAEEKKKTNQQQVRDYLNYTGI